MTALQPESCVDCPVSAVMFSVNKRETILGFAVLTVFVVLYFAYINADQHEERVLDEEQSHARLATRTLEAASHVRHLHRSLHNFLLSRDLLEAPEVGNGKAELDTIIQDLEAESPTASLEHVSRLSDRYSHSISQIVELRQNLGLSHDEGLEGQLRHAVHQAESVLANANQNELLVHLLQLRRHEKDFMMRREWRYISKFEKRLEIFKQGLLSSNLEPDDLSAVSAFMDTYSNGFARWVQLCTEMNHEIEVSEAIYMEIVDQIKETTAHYISATKTATRKRVAAQMQNDIMLLSMIILMLASGAMLVMMVGRYRQFSDKVEALANTDTLTALPNRRGFFKLFENELSRTHLRDESIVVGVIDLDGFKAVNDIFGHAAGDALLAETGKRLRDVLGKDAVIGRMGGDEFALVLSGEYTSDKILEIGNQICSALAIPYEIKEGMARVSGSIGFTLSNCNKLCSTSLYEHADYALYHSKKNARGRPILFSQEHESEIREASTIEQKLLEADDDEFRVEYQPIIDASQDRVIGMEALARWNSPTLGEVRPDVFINKAEQTGTITRLTAILLKKALEAAKKWPDNVYLSFNLSALDLASPESAMRLLGIIENSGFPTNRLFLEITETAIVKDFERSMMGLELLLKSGVRFALDDFGTGYSSLSYLQRLPVERLKIDRSFSEGLETKKATRDIVRSLISLCKNLGIDCVVEGIEHRTQIDILSELGASYIQGFYFSPPLHESDAEAYLQKKAKPLETHQVEAA